MMIEKEAINVDSHYKFKSVSTFNNLEHGQVRPGKPNLQHVYCKMMKSKTIIKNQRHKYMSLIGLVVHLTLEATNINITKEEKEPKIKNNGNNTGTKHNYQRWKKN